MGDTEPPKQASISPEAHHQIVQAQEQLMLAAKATKDTLDRHNRLLFGEDGTSGLAWRIRVLEEAEKRRAENQKWFMGLVAAVVAMVGKTLWEMITKAAG